MYRIFLADNIGYGLDNDCPEELFYEDWLIKEMDDMKKDLLKNECLLIRISEKE